MSEVLAFVGLAGLTISLTANIYLAVWLWQTRKLAYKDPLTGLWSRRYMEENLPKAVAKTQRLGQGLAVIMLDLDEFKQINDTLGHSVGDVCLKQAAHVIRDNLRQYDEVIRYGGDEFAIILAPVPMAGEDAVCEPDTEEVKAVAEKIRYALGDMGGSNTITTASLGVACLPGPGCESAEALMAAADSALYQAKRAGRNRVVFWDEERS